MIHRNMNEKYSPKKILNAIQIRLDLKIAVCSHPTDPTPEVPIQNISLDP